MKLCRIGKVNNEKPALIDNDGIFRDLSKTISDFDIDFNVPEREAIMTFLDY